MPVGHRHDHDEDAYEDHDEDLHLHKHSRKQRQPYRDHAGNHAHEHAHSFYHGHYHTHDPEHTTWVHRIFRDPLRDWFALVLMAVLIVVGYMEWLPGFLSNGMIICAAVIGIFPILKNAIFDTIAKRRPNLELLLGIGLVAGLATGRFLHTAILALVLLVGSFLKLNFSWKNE